MKSRFVLLVVSVLLIFCFISCNNETPTPVTIDRGTISWRGSSDEAPQNPEKYDVYFNTTDGCTYIYDGTQWTLMALKGETGEPGLNGKSIIWKGSYSSSDDLQNPKEYWAYYNTTNGSSYIYVSGGWTVLARSGTSITWKGSFTQAPADPSLYDAYYNTSDGCSYIYDGTGWSVLASKGARGDTGMDGKSIQWKGTYPSHPDNPEELWTYYNSTDGNAYIYSNGKWQLLIENLAVNYDTPTIIGTIIANGACYSVENTYVKIVDESTTETVWNSKPASDGDFAVSSLDGGKTYTIYFTSNRLSDVNIKRTRDLTAADGTYGAVRTGVVPAAGKAKNVGEVILTPNGTVRGRVELGDGSTPEGIDVYLENTSYAAKTASDGSYTIGDIVQGTYTIVFSMDGYNTVTKDAIIYSSDLTADPELTIPNVKLIAGTSTLTGTVTYSDKTDACGINVLLINSAGITVRTAVTSTADGKFSFASIAPDSYTLRAKADGYVALDKTITVTEGESYLLPMGGLVNLSGSITGKVTMNDLTAGASVKVTAVSSDGSRSYEAKTDSTGAYIIEDVYNGKYNLTFEKDGFLASTAEVIVEAGTSSYRDIEMKSIYGSVRVTAALVDTSNPEGIIISIYKDGVLLTSTTVTSTGSTTFTRIEIGDGYSVVASCDGYGSVGEDKVSVASGETTTVNLPKLSNKFGAVKGKVVDRNGTALADATVSLFAADGNSYTLTTGADGSFSKTDAAIGTYSVRVSKEGWQTTTLASTYTVESSKTTDITDSIVLKSKFALITGKASYAEKTDSSNISVTIEDADGKTLSTIVTGTDGTFTFSVEEGTYTIRANAVDYNESLKTVSVKADSSYVLTLDGIISQYSSVSGKVLSSKGALAGAAVRLVSSDGTSYTVTSASDGTFTHTRVKTGTYEISISRSEYKTVTLALKYTVEAGKTASIPDVTLQSTYATITGTVGYADSSDPSGILVSALNSSGTNVDSMTTGTDGSFSLRVIEGTYTIKASKSGYGDVRKEISVAADKSYMVEMGTLKNSYGTVKGRIVDTTSTAVGGATIRLNGDDGNSYTTTSLSDGTYSLSSVLVGDYSVSVSMSGYKSATLSEKIAVESSAVKTVSDITLTSSYATIKGTAGYSEKTDASGILVSISTEDGISVDTYTTDSDGAFSFRVGSGTYTIKATKDNYIDVKTTVTVVEGRTTTVNLTKLRNCYGSICGKVTDTSGNPIAGATVFFSGDGGSSCNASTLSDGTYSNASIGIGTYTISISKADYRTTTLPLKYTVESALNTTVEDTALPSIYAVINGSVGYADKTASDGIFVSILDSASVSVGTTTTGEDGSFRFKVSEGSYTIKASKTNYDDIKKDISVVADKTYTVEMGRLKNTYGTLRGKVIDSTGNAITGAVVTVTNMDGSESPYTLSTNENGEFSSSTILVGSYSLSITKSGYVDIVVNSIPVVGGSEYDIGTKTMVIGSAGITGRVILEGVTNYSGVTVTATSTTDSTKVYSTTTADDGSYYFLSLDSDTYSIKLQKTGFISDSTQQVSLENGMISGVKTITLKNESSTLTGTVTLTGGADYTAVQVLVKDTSSTTTFSTTTDRNGKYIINNITAGTYELIFSKDGYGSVTVKDVQIGKGEEKSLDTVSLEIAYTSVKGKVTLEEATDYSGTLITATNISAPDLIYSAITNSDGNFTLAKMYAGEYSIVVSRNNYLSATLKTVTVRDDTPIDCGETELAIAKGEITGLVRLQGYSDFSGIKVSLLGTGKMTTTAEDGSYSFTVPAGNYSGGIRYEYDDFETTSYATNIAVLPTTSYSDAYVVPDIEMKCLRVPKISGKVTIYGLTKAQYQDITITIAELPEFTYTTGEDGTYCFEHVPDGTYTFEFTRENARKVTKIVAVEAAPEIKIENIELIPDAVTLYGNISLTGVTDYSGVTVRITTPDSVELKTVTNAAGYWYISNIVASKSHTITFEKAGWLSQSFNIAADAYEPLSETNYNTEHPVALVDTVAPVISALTATVGKSTEAGREIYLYLYTQEEGSGVKYIQGNTSNTFDGVTEQEYYNPFKLIIPDELGDKTIYVRIKDAAGNISNTVSTNVVLKNDKTELYQTLSGDKLHLKATDDNGEHIVYLMTDNILVPSGETLVIDPGVEIQINGAYYIQVEGTLSAIGTADDRIKIYGIDNGLDKWLGFKILNDNGSKIAYADISGLYDGIQGYCDIDNSIITAADTSSDRYDYYGYALGSYKNSKYLYGTVTNSNISGKIYARLTDVLNNTMTSDYIKELTASGSIFNNEFAGTLSGTITGSLVQNTFSGTGILTFSSVYMMNNKVDVNSVKVTDSIVKYTTFNSSALDISGGAWSYNTLNNCTFSNYSVYRFTNSNLNGCGTITITSKRLTQEIFNMKNNYWGAVNTVELDQKSATDQVSFIYHYANDFNLTRVDWSDYVKTALADCGYQGKGFRTTGSYSGYQIGDTGPAGGIVFYDKGYYSDGWRYLEAATADIGEYVFGYYRLSDVTNNVVGTGISIGTGKDNTDYLVEAMDVEGKTYSSSSTSDTTLSEYAARKCSDYESGGYSDWFLPSKEELNLMYLNLKKAGLGSFTTSFCWSSSESSGYYAWAQGFYNGNQYGDYRFSNLYVRPVRAF